MKDIILGAIPVVASLISTGVIQKVFVGTVRKLLKNKDNEAEELRKYNRELAKNIEEQTQELKATKEVQDSKIALLSKQVTELLEERIVMTKLIEELKKSIDSDTTIRNQIKSLINKKD